MKNVFLFFLLSVLTFSSCSKDNTLSKTELISQEWTFTSRIVDPPISVNGVNISDLFAQADACDKDDFISFKSDGRYTVEEGSSKCDNSSPQISEVGTWQFNSDESIVVLTDSDNFVTEVNILSLTKDIFEMNFVEEEDGINYTYSFTLSSK